MKFFTKTLLFVFMMSCTGILSAQDAPHFSLFEYAPLNTNPAFTGAFEGTFRVGGIYRDQWFSFLPNQFTTPAIYGDAPLIKGFRDKDWIGVGITFYSDNAGTGKLQVGGALFSASYHFALDKKRNSVFTIGLQGGSISRQIDTQELLFGDDIANGNNTPGNTTTEMGLADNRNLFDINVGVLLRSQVNKQTNLRLGLAVKHLTTPTYTLIQSGNRPDSSFTDLPLRVTFHGGFGFDLNKKWTLSPTFIYNQIRNQNEIALQGWMDYKLNPEKELSLRFGAGYRLRDAAEVLFGVDIKTFRFALAYDVNVSDLTEVSNTVGGLEFAASYIVKIFKDPEIKPIIFCPRF